MIINDFEILLLSGDSIRTCFYSQNLKYHSYNFSCLSYGSKRFEGIKINSTTEKFFIDNNHFIPNTEIDLETFCKNSKIKHEKIDVEDINSIKIINYVKHRNPDLVIFSGFGGDLLSKQHFSLNIPYLHLHPGDLPNEKGSTTIYFSILSKRFVTVTSFIMNEKIDSGDIILKCRYDLPKKGVDIDYFFDNLIRSNCLIKTLESIKKKNRIESDNIRSNDLEYYIIHPVLKHLSLLSL